MSLERQGEPTPRTVGQLVGENVKQLREQRDWTQAELVMRWQSLGLGWPRSKLSMFESGERKSLQFSDVVLIALALDVGLDDLLGGGGAVALKDGGAPVPLALLREWFARERGNEEIKAVLKAGDAASASAPLPLERDMANRLGVPTHVVSELAQARWHRTLAEERDRRVQTRGASTPGERRAFRGHVTRQLEEELNRDLERKHMGYDGQ